MKFKTGFTLLEMLVVLMFIGLLLAGAQRVFYRDAQEQNSIVISSYHNRIIQGAQDYIRANGTALKASATAATPTAITVAQLKTAGALPSSFSNIDRYGGTPCVLVLQPTAGRLQAVYVTEGGQAVPFDQQFRIAKRVKDGALVELISAVVTANAIGGIYTLPLTAYQAASCSGTPVSVGKLAAAMLFDANNVPAPYLNNTTITGNPNANTMFTNLNMNNNNITNVGAITGDTANFNTINTNTLNSTGNIKAPCLVDPTNSLYFVCPGATSNLKTVKAESLSAPEMIDSDNPTFKVNPNGVSVLNNAILTSRSVNVFLKDYLPNIVVQQQFVLNMASGAGGLVAVPAPTCGGAGVATIFLSLQKAQAVLSGVTTTYHVDKTATGSGWNVAIYDQAGVAQTQGIVVAQTSCDYSGL